MPKAKSGFKTAKDILISTDFLQGDLKAQRYVKHEFQDYAYRLASDLGDIQHKAIYMKLAKTVDRTTLEQAATFALEYFNERNKGKIFMWKLAQLREQASQRRALTNFDHDFVLDRMGKLFDELHPTLIQKQQKEFPAKKVLLENLNLTPNSKRSKVLCVGTGCGYDLSWWEFNGWKPEGWDISRKFIDTAKQNTGNNKLVVRKKWSQIEPLKSKSQAYDVIHFQLWPFIPQDSEVTYLDLLTKSMSDEGKIFIEFTNGETGQSWQELNLKNDTKFTFSKFSNPEQIIQQLKKFKIDTQDIIKLSERKSVIYASKK